MISCGIRQGGRQVGTLRMWREGLMTVFAAETRRLPGVPRLQICSGGRVLSLGVLSPEGEGMSLRRSFSGNALRELGFVGLEGAFVAEEAWREVSRPETLFRDPVLQESAVGVKGVLVQGKTAAFPVEAGAPFGLMPLFRRGKPLEMGGRLYLLFETDLA